MPSFEYVHRDGNVALSNVGMHYLEWGSAGPTVLIVHGISGMAIRWEGFARTLMDDFHVYAIDLRGHGHSSWAGSYTLDDYGGDVEEFIDAVGLSDPILLGHSLGAAISMRFLGTRSHSISRFVCVDMGPEIAVDRSRSRSPTDENRSFGSAAEAVERMKELLPRIENEDPEEYVYNHYRWTREGSMEARHDPGIFGWRRAKGESPWTLWDEVRRIRIPTLVVRGENSFALSAEIAARMVGEMPDAKLVEMPGTNHVLNVEDPANFNQIVGDFIRR